MSDVTAVAVMEAIAGMRADIAKLSSLIEGRRRGQWFGLTRASRESGRPIQEIKNAILRHELKAVPCTARGGKPSHKIKPTDLQKWMEAQA